MPGTIAFMQSANSTADLSTYTFGSQNFGAAASDRVLIAAVTSRRAGGVDVSSVTIGGVTAARVVSATSTEGVTAIYAASVPTGASGTVEVVLTGTALRCNVDLYLATGIAATAHATQATASFSGTTLSVSLDVPAGGVALAAAQSGGGSGAWPWTWSGLTERSDLAVESAMRPTSAADEFASAQSGLSISATLVGGTPVTPSLAVASWGPAGGSVVPLLVHHMRMQGMA